jgi:hypothetical protein
MNNITGLRALEYKALVALCWLNVAIIGTSSLLAASGIMPLFPAIMLYQ